MNRLLCRLGQRISPVLLYWPSQHGGSIFVDSPTQRSLRLLRKQGWTVAVTEKWNHHVKCRQDLFGFADLLAFDAESVLLIQTTTSSNMAARIHKIYGNAHALEWVSGGRAIWVHGWRKGKNGRWICRETVIDQRDREMFDVEDVDTTGGDNGTDRS